MIDPRFANDGAFPFAVGYGMPDMPMPYHHHRRHRHGHHKLKIRNNESPLIRDDSIHHVDHGHPRRHRHHRHHRHHRRSPQNNDVSGEGANFEHANEHQDVLDEQGSSVRGTPVQTVEHTHHDHREERDQSVEAGNISPLDGRGMSEQLIGQRAPSTLSNQEQLRSPIPESDLAGGQVIRRRHHRHHHHGGERGHGGHTHHSHHSRGHSGDGYGHIGHDLIFIERSDHSPHRQEPPSGYEFKGRIEVQGVDREFRSQSRGPPLPPIPIPIPSPPICGPCPSGAQQIILTPAGVPCPSGGTLFTGQLTGATGMDYGYGNYGGGFGGGSGGGFGGGFGGGSGGGFDGGFGGGSGGGFGGGSGGGFGGGGFSGGFGDGSGGGFGGGSGGGFGGGSGGGFGGGSGGGFGGGGFSGGFTEQFQTEQAFERPGRLKVIEVWQKRSRTERPRPSSPTTGQSFDFERFRSEIFAAIERIGGRGHGGDQVKIIEKESSSSGEVRVIVQPIQPVFYMPRQTETSGTQITHPIIGPQQPAPAAPTVVYVPRNVYVPVIKPVFVPRERVIVRPQVVHVARPVIVDRPVPVTQRPIIIDRERPIPVPVRPAVQPAQTAGSQVVREEYVYRDNLPVAYGGRCAEFAGGINYGYMPRQQEHQYASSSSYDVTNVQPISEVINVTVPNQFQNSYSGANLNARNLGRGQRSYSNLAGLVGASAHGRTQIEVLDATVNPNWQRTDQSTLLHRYGRPAADIVHRSEEVEQQLFTGFQQGASGGGVIRSSSAVRYA